MASFVTILCWIVLPLLIFWFGFQEGVRRKLLGQITGYNRSKDCKTSRYMSFKNGVFSSLSSGPKFNFSSVINSEQLIIPGSPKFDVSNAGDFHHHRFDYMGNFELLGTTLVEIENSDRNNHNKQNRNNAFFSSSSPSCQQ